MAVEFSAAGSTDQTADTSDVTISLGIPANISEGDLMIAIITNRREQSRTISNVPSGWSTINNTAGTTVFAFYKEAGASEASNSPYTFTASGGYCALGGGIVRCTGHDSADLASIALNGEEHLETYNATVNLPSTTVATTGNGLLWCGGRLASGGGFVVSTSRSGDTERINLAGGSSPYGVGTWVFTEDNVSSGSISGETFTLNGSAGDKYAISIEIPALVAATTQQILSISSQNYALAFTK